MAAGIPARCLGEEGLGDLDVARHSDLGVTLKGFTK
jgi:hypothetical protein